MNQLKQNTPANTFSGQDTFARALAESEKGTTQKPSAPDDDFLKALMDSDTGNSQEDKFAAQKEFLQRRNRLHNEVNPSDQTEVFAARALKNQKDIENLRAQLRANYSVAVHETPELDNTLQSNVPQQETTDVASYIRAFLHHVQIVAAKIQAYITSARDSGAWASTHKNKKAKGLGKGGYQTTKAVWDQSHHENAVSTQGAG